MTTYRVWLHFLFTPDDPTGVPMILSSLERWKKSGLIEAGGVEKTVDHFIVMVISTLLPRLPGETDGSHVQRVMEDLTPSKVIRISDLERLSESFDGL